MNTHILIPIKDIEQQIKIIRQAIASAVKTKDAQLQFLLEEEIERKHYILRLGKQISLDENDIKKKAKSSHKLFNKLNGKFHDHYQVGYEQALKDLL